VDDDGMAWHGMQNKGKEISQIKSNQVKINSPEQHHGGGIKQNMQDRRYMDNGLRAQGDRYRCLSRRSSDVKASQLHTDWRRCSSEENEKRKGGMSKQNQLFA
jgi:hypothetical protein